MESIHDDTNEGGPPPYLQEGTDAVVFLFSSSSTEQYQEHYKNEYIHCKTQYKRLRNRSVRFYAVDMNTDSKLPFLQTLKFPGLILFPAYHKQSSQFVFEQKVESRLIAKWIHKHADIKFDLKEDVYFKEKTQGQESAMKMGKDGQMVPDEERIR